MDFLSYLFGCRHRRFTFPQTSYKRNRPEAAITTGTWITCLDCSKEFAYDFHAMKVVKQSNQRLCLFFTQRKQADMQVLNWIQENPVLTFFLVALVFSGVIGIIKTLRGTL